MSATPPERSARRALDLAALQRVTLRLSRSAQAPWLHTEVARRMAQRLPLMRMKPQLIVNWSAFVGGGSELLRQAYPGASVLAAERDTQRRDATAADLRAPWWSPGRWRGGAQSAVIASDLAAGQGQLLWANMVLHGALDPQQLMATWHRAVAVDGLLMFSTLGSGSLQGLSRIYAAARWPVPLAPFVDMHDLGDMLIEAGWADPVMDQEQVTLTWPSAEALLAELRQLGGNVDPRRFAGLRTPRWRQNLCERLQATAQADGRIAMDFEVVYGHAFKPLPRPRVAAQTSVALDDMRALVRQGRRPL